MTEQEIKIRAICAILTGRTSNPDYADISISTIVSEAIHASDLLITELWKDEQLTPPRYHHTDEHRPHPLQPVGHYGHSESCQRFSDFRSPLNRFSKPNRSLDTVFKNP